MVCYLAIDNQKKRAGWLLVMATQYQVGQSEAIPAEPLPHLGIHKIMNKLNGCYFMPLCFGTVCYTNKKKKTHPILTICFVFHYDHTVSLYSDFLSEYFKRQPKFLARSGVFQF